MTSIDFLSFTGFRLSALFGTLLLLAFPADSYGQDGPDCDFCLPCESWPEGSQLGGWGVSNWMVVDEGQGSACVQDCTSLGDRCEDVTMLLEILEPHYLASSGTFNPAVLKDLREQKPSALRSAPEHSGVFVTARCRESGTETVIAFLPAVAGAGVTATGVHLQP